MISNYMNAISSLVGVELIAGISHVPHRNLSVSGFLEYAILLANKVKTLMGYTIDSYSILFLKLHGVESKY